MQARPPQRKKDSYMAMALRAQLVQRRSKNAGGVRAISRTKTSLLEEASGGKHRVTRQKPTSAGPVISGTKTIIWVGNLNSIYADERQPSAAELREVFQDIGDVQTVYCACTKPLTWALVVFIQPDSVDHAVRNPPHINGVVLSTEPAFLLEIGLSGRPDTRSHRSSSLHGHMHMESRRVWSSENSVWLHRLDGPSSDPGNIVDMCSQFGTVKHMLIRHDAGNCAAEADKSWAVVNFGTKEGALRAILAEETLCKKNGKMVKISAMEKDQITKRRQDIASENAANESADTQQPVQLGDEVEALLAKRYNSTAGQLEYLAHFWGRAQRPQWLPRCVLLNNPVTNGILNQFEEQQQLLLERDIEPTRISAIAETKDIAEKEVNDSAAEVNDSADTTLPPLFEPRSWSIPVWAPAILRKKLANATASGVSAYRRRRPQSAQSHRDNKLAQRARTATGLLQQHAAERGRTAAARPKSAGPKRRPHLPSNSIHLAALAARRGFEVNIELLFHCSEIIPPNDMHLDTRIEVFEIIKCEDFGDETESKIVSLGKTEVKRVCKRPHFSSAISAAVRRSGSVLRQQQLLVVLSQVNSQAQNYREIGRVVFGLESLCASRKHRGTFKLGKKALRTKHLVPTDVDDDCSTLPQDKYPSVTVTASQTNHECSQLWFRISFSAFQLCRCNSRPGCSFPSRQHRFDPYLTISRLQHGLSDVVLCTDVVPDTVNPEWLESTISFQLLCGGDENTELHVRVYNRQLDHQSAVYAEEELLGECVVTLNLLRRAARAHSEIATNLGRSAARNRQPVTKRRQKMREEAASTNDEEGNHVCDISAHLHEDAMELVHETSGGNSSKPQYTNVGWLRCTEFECYWLGQQNLQKSAHVNDQHYLVDSNFLSHLKSQPEHISTEVMRLTNAGIRLMEERSQYWVARRAQEREADAKRVSELPHECDDEGPEVSVDKLSMLRHHVKGLAGIANFIAAQQNTAKAKTNENKLIRRAGTRNMDGETEEEESDLVEIHPGITVPQGFGRLAKQAVLARRAVRRGRIRLEEQTPRDRASTSAWLDLLVAVETNARLESQQKSTYDVDESAALARSTTACRRGSLPSDVNQGIDQLEAQPWQCLSQEVRHIIMGRRLARHDRESKKLQQEMDNLDQHITTLAGNAKAVPNTHERTLPAVVCESHTNVRPRSADSAQHLLCNLGVDRHFKQLASGKSLSHWDHLKRTLQASSEYQASVHRQHQVALVGSSIPRSDPNAVGDKHLGDRAVKDKTMLSKPSSARTHRAVRFGHTSPHIHAGGHRTISRVNRGTIYDKPSLPKNKRSVSDRSLMSVRRSRRNEHFNCQLGKQSSTDRTDSQRFKPRAPLKQQPVKRRPHRQVKPHANVCKRPQSAPARRGSAPSTTSGSTNFEAKASLNHSTDAMSAMVDPGSPNQNQDKMTLNRRRRPTSAGSRSSLAGDTANTRTRSDKICAPLPPSLRALPQVQQPSVAATFSTSSATNSGDIQSTGSSKPMGLVRLSEAAASDCCAQHPRSHRKRTKMRKPASNLQSSRMRLTKTTVQRNTGSCSLHLQNMTAYRPARKIEVQSLNGVYSKIAGTWHHWQHIGTKVESIAINSYNVQAPRRSK